MFITILYPRIFFRHVLGNLAHLELAVSGTGPNRINVAVEVVLCYGLCLESLRLLVLGMSIALMPSEHFRTYAHALPQLRNFGFLLPYRTTPNRDFLPAVSKFLQGRSHLESLELVDFQDSIIGLDLDSWKFLSSFFNLRRLSIITQAHFPMNLPCQYIPRTVLSLGLSSGGAYSWFCGDLWPSACLLQITQWQPNRLSHRFRR